MVFPCWLLQQQTNGDGSQIKWYRSLIPILEEYLTNTGILENGSSSNFTAIQDTEHSEISEKSLASITQNGNSPSINYFQG